MMKTLISTTILLGLLTSMPYAIAADDAATMKKAEKPLSCKAQAKKNGLKDKKEISAFVKKCSTDMASAKKMKKAM